MSNWELKDDQDISWWHCGQAGYWEGEEVYCSKCQAKLEDDDFIRVVDELIAMID
jgi:hypothetical protein